MENKKSKQSVCVTAKKLGINGEGIGYLEGKPVFVDQLLPGEAAEISLTEIKERYAKGRINKRLNDSPLRVTPACSVQGRCSGCPLMILQPQAQLQMKRELVQEALIKYAGLPRSLVQSVIASPLHLGYRNQCKLPIRQEHGQLVSGLYEEGSNRIIPIHSCLVHDEHLEALRKQIMGLLNQFKLSAYDPKTETGLRTLVLRYLDGQFQCVLVTGKSALPSDLIEKLKQIPGLVCLMQNINPDKRSRQLFSSRWKLLAGEDRLPVQLGQLQLNLSCASFFQLNRPQACQLYQKAASLIKPCTTLVEAYSGIGGISLMLKDKAKTIIGIESIHEAVDNANENARLNQADHVRFVCGDAAEEMKKISRKRKIDAVVVDPPRTGLDGAMIESLRQCQPEQIVYISCNPATLGKNIKELKDLYEVKTVIPFDMFPNTAHVETVVMLSHKKPDSVINVKVEFGEGEGKVPLDNIAKRAAAYKPKERITYKMIKEYIEAKYGFKVHTAYIAEVKRDLGLPMYDAPNAVEELKQPRKHPTAEKVEAIKDALKYYKEI